MVLACVDPGAAPGDFYSPAGKMTGAPRRHTQATLAAGDKAERDPMYLGARLWVGHRAETVDGFMAAAAAATGLPRDAWSQRR
jgi:hypothetical protein